MNNLYPQPLLKDQDLSTKGKGAQLADKMDALKRRFSRIFKRT
jgi:hypothetical protein